MLYLENCLINLLLFIEVGFTSPQFNVHEGDRTVEITVGLISGILRSEVEITFSVVGLDAFGKAKEQY